MGDELTVDNFILRIKEMDARDRKKIRAADLIDLILQLPESNTIHDQGERIDSLVNTVQNLVASVDNLKTLAHQNAAEIINLNTKNNNITAQNEQLEKSVNEFKKTANQNLILFQEDITAINKQLNEIEQYLRINNLEIVGLPEPNENETETNMIIEALNSSLRLDDEIRIADIVAYVLEMYKITI